MLIARKVQRTGNAVNVLRVLVVFIITVLVLHKQKDVQAAHSANSKTDNIDETESLVLKQKANSGFEVAFDHDS